MRPIKPLPRALGNGAIDKPGARGFLAGTTRGRMSMSTMALGVSDRLRLRAEYEANAKEGV